MSTILQTWELGAGLGHLIPLRAIGQELVRRGHRVVAAVRDLTHVAEVFAGTGIEFLLAPVIPRFGRPVFEPTHGYAHVLGNIGFATEPVMATLFAAWNTLYNTVRPDLVIADHSPTALLALRGLPIRRVNIGTGFFCPPDTLPLPIWLPPNDLKHQKVQADEEAITAKVNRLLEANRRPALQRLGQVVNDNDGVFLATYREFDPFGPRPGIRYWGHWPFNGGREPVWPEGQGPKVFAYLKRHRELEALLIALQKSGAPTLIFGSDIERALQERFTGPTMRFESQPLDMQQVAARCDMAILHGGHGATMAMMLAGKPCLLVPLVLEQMLTARMVERAGAGRVCAPQGAMPVANVLQEMINNPGYRTKAHAIAVRHAANIPGQQVPEVVDQLERLFHNPMLRLARLPAR